MTKLSNLELCPQSKANYCDNGGTCYASINDPTDILCSCTLPYYGARCDRIVKDSVLYKTLRSHYLDRTLTVIGLVITFIIFFFIVTISWYISWRRKKDLEIWKNNKKKNLRYKTVQVSLLPDLNMERLLNERRRRDSRGPQMVSIGVNTCFHWDGGCDSQPTSGLINGVLSSPLTPYHQVNKSAGNGGMRSQDMQFRGNSQILQVTAEVNSSNCQNDEMEPLLGGSGRGKASADSRSATDAHYARLNSYPPPSQSSGHSRHRSANDATNSTLPLLDTSISYNNYSPSRSTNQPSSRAALTGLTNFPNGGHYNPLAVNSAYNTPTRHSHQDSSVAMVSPLHARYQTSSLMRGSSNVALSRNFLSSSDHVSHRIDGEDPYHCGLPTDNATSGGYFRHHNNSHLLGFTPSYETAIHGMNHIAGVPGNPPPSSLRVASEHDALLHELMDRGYASYDPHQFGPAASHHHQRSSSLHAGHQPLHYHPHQQQHHSHHQRDPLGHSQSGRSGIY